MIDHHAHAFSSETGSFDPAGISLDVVADEGLDARRAAIGPTRLMQELMTVRLAARLGCEPEEVPEARAAAAGDWGAYVSGLFRDAGIEGVLLDAPVGPGMGEAARCQELSGATMHPIHRIDPTVDRLIEAGAGATEILEVVSTEMREAAASGAVGFKTILAYRTGLGVDPSADLKEAEASLLVDAPVRRRGKACRDLVIRVALALAGELGRPFQFHTGFGDSDLRLAESNPLLLEDLLRTPEGSSTPVVLIHGSYPWHEEVAFLATTKANVYADVSLSNLFAPLTVGDRLTRILELAPAAKVVMATDGHGAPETFWFAAGVLRDAWRTARDRMRDAGARDRWLEDVEDRIFGRTTTQLYGL